MQSQCLRNLLRFSILFLAFSGVAGCTGQSSPSLPLFGAYFPFWLICLAAGVVGAVVVRVVFIRLGIDEGLPFRLLVYTCVAAAIGFVLALTVFGR